MSEKTERPVLQVLEEIYHHQRGSRRRLWPEDRLIEDLYIDSLASLELLVAVEERLHVRIFDDPRAQRVRTIGDLADLVAQCQATP